MLVTLLTSSQFGLSNQDETTKHSHDLLSGSLNMMWYDGMPFGKLLLRELANPATKRKFYERVSTVGSPCLYDEIIFVGKRATQILIS